MYRKVAKYDPATGQFPVIEYCITFLTSLAPELFETGFALELIQSIRSMFVSIIVLEKNVFSCSSLGSWDGVLLKENLPNAVKNFKHGFKFVTNLFRISKQPSLPGTLHVLLEHWEDLVRANPFARKDWPFGLGLLNEICLETTNLPSKKGLTKYILFKNNSHTLQAFVILILNIFLLFVYARRNIPVSSAIAHVHKRLVFNNSPDNFFRFTGMKTKEAVNMRMWALLDDIEETLNRARLEPPRIIDFEETGHESDQENCMFAHSTDSLDRRERARIKRLREPIENAQISTSKNIRARDILDSVSESFSDFIDIEDNAVFNSIAKNFFVQS